MPYYIYQIGAFRQLKLLDTVAEYRAARQQVRELRRQSSDAGETTTTASYRMIFAASENEAERLLTTKREPRPMGEHD